MLRKETRDAEASFAIGDCMRRSFDEENIPDVGLREVICD